MAGPSFGRPPNLTMPRPRAKVSNQCPGGGALGLLGFPYFLTRPNLKVFNLARTREPMMPLRAMLNIMLHFALWPLVGAGLFVLPLGLSEGPIFLGAGVGAVLRAAVAMIRKEESRGYFITYFLFGPVLIFEGLKLLGWV